MAVRWYKIPVSLLQGIVTKRIQNFSIHLAKHTFVAIAATESLRVSKLKEAKMCNIASVDWLVRAVGANLPLSKLIKFHPSDMLCCSDRTANEFRRKYDLFSDSFTKKVSADQLKSILNSMDEKVRERTFFFVYNSIVISFIKGIGRYESKRILPFGN